jgi:hypothetical protein
MKNSEWPSIDSALGELVGLPEDARVADDTITKYLRQKFAEILVNEQRRRLGPMEDEASIALWASKVTNRVVLDPSALYNLFDLQMKNELREFWKGLDFEPSPSARGAMAPPAPEPAPPPQEDAHWNMKKERRFHCTEGCEFVGEELYLAHRDRGHHPVPL